MTFNYNIGHLYFKMPITSLFRFFIVIFFLLMLVVPTSFAIYRLPILILLILCTMFHYITSNRLFLCNSVAFVFILNILSSAIFLLNGAILNAPGVISVSTVYLVWPILFITFVGLTNNLQNYRFLVRCIPYAAIASSVLGLALAILTFMNMYGYASFLFDSLGARIGFYDGIVEYSLPNIATLIYAFPVLLTALMLRGADRYVIGSKILLLTALFFCIIAGVLTGRRAIFLIFMISPFVAFFLIYLSRTKGPSVKEFLLILVIILSGVFIFGQFFGLNFLKVVENFFNGFEFDPSTATLSSSIRSSQFHFLISGWTERPILGHGLGAVSNDIVRSESHPWTFELSYVALLFHTGIAGIFIYLGSILWLFTSSILLIRNRPECVGYLLPPLAGLICFLIANATNPYLSKFDFLWVIFLSTGLLNAATLEKRI